VSRILTQIGEPTHPPAIALARGPPDWNDQLEPRLGRDVMAQPAPEYAFDQRVSC
jgi:hypothetical protein